MKLFFNFWPDKNHFFEETHQNQLASLKNVFYGLLTISAVIITMMFGRFLFIDFTNDMILETIIAAVSLFISVVMAGVVFIWSWSSFAHSSEIAMRTRRASTGEMIEYDSVGQQIDDFVAELVGENVSEDAKICLENISRISLMLSTPMYGIEAKRNPTVSMHKLISSLRKWIETTAPLRHNIHLELCIWPREEHRKIWGVPTVDAQDNGSKWYTDKSIKHIEGTLKCMVELCQLMGCLKKFGDAQSVDFTIREIPRNDTRIFLVQRRSGLPYSLFVVFSKFEGEIIRKEKFRMVGFSSMNSYTYNAIRDVKNTYTDLATNEGLAASTDNIISRPFDFIADYFRLNEDWHGFESFEILQASFDDWTSADINKFNLRPQAQLIVDGLLEAETNSANSVNPD